jgi:hypothetical protein
MFKPQCGAYYELYLESLSGRGQIWVEDSIAVLKIL